jgi:hypothetical protein
MKMAFCTLICLFSLVCVNAHAADANFDEATEKDLRCMLVSMQMSNSPVELARKSAMPATMYFFGKLDGRTPKLNLEDAMIAITMKVAKEPSETARATATRCGKELMVRGAVMTVVGQHIVQRGQKMMELENSR